MKNRVIAVVGATGKTGQRVLEQLQDLGHVVRGLSRSSEISFDWSDRSTWGNALKGVHSVYLTYFPDLAVPQAESDVRTFVEVAKKNGVQHIVLLSGRGEEGAERAEEVLQTSGIEWNVVRAGWFMQNFSESFMLEGLQAGQLVLPEPKSKEAFIDVDDIVEVAIATLTRSELRNQLFELTGPELLSFEACVEQITIATNRTITFQTAPIDSYLASAKAQGLSEDMAWLINELFVNVLDGRNASTTNTIEYLLGRPARSFDEYVAKTLQSGVWAETHTERSA